MSNFDPTHLEPRQETLVRDYLCQQLDGQLGKSQERFHQFLQHGAQPSERVSFPIGGRFRGWMFSVAGAAVAACLGFLAGGPQFHSRTVSTQVDHTTPVTFPWVQQTVDQQDYDGGTIVDANGDPLKVLNRHSWQTTRWYDRDKKLKAESVEPQEETIYLKMKTY